MCFAIETDHLILRDLRADDLPILTAQFTDPALRDFILPMQAGEAFTQAYVESAIVLARQQPRYHYILAITLKQGGKVIGTCSLYNAVPDGNAAQVGWNLGSPHWGNGYATEAAKQLLYIGFELNDVHRIFADGFAHNAASTRVMEKIGMSRHWGGALFQRLRSMSYGVKHPVLRYQIWREQWLSQNYG